MRAFSIPCALLLAAALVVGCQDTSTSPNVNELELDPMQLRPSDQIIDRNGDKLICVLNTEAGQIQIDNVLPDADEDGFLDCPPKFGIPLPY